MTSEIIRRVCRRQARDRAGRRSPSDRLVLLAGSVERSVNYYVVNEDIVFPHPGMSGGERPFVRADIVYFTTRNGGAMFSTSSIAWCGSLSWNHYENNVSKLMENVLTQFAKDEPAPAL